MSTTTDHDLAMDLARDACERAEAAAREADLTMTEMQIGDVLAGKIISEILGTDPEDRASLHNRVASMPVHCEGCPTFVRLQAERDELVQRVAELERYPAVSRAVSKRVASAVPEIGCSFNTISGV